MILRKEEIIKFFEQNNSLVRFLDKDDSEIIIQKIIALTNGDKLHYLWANFKSDSFVNIKKISCDKDIYIKSLVDSIDFNQMYLIVDGVCFIDSIELVIEISKKELIELLKVYYWELDEIYILNIQCNRFFSINHNFELSLYEKVIDSL